MRPLHLATFYLGGAYLDLGRRLLGLRYLLLSRRNEGPGERAEWEATRAAYALAGLLLLARTVLVASRRVWTGGEVPPGPRSGVDEDPDPDPGVGEMGLSPPAGGDAGRQEG